MLPDLSFFHTNRENKSAVPKAEIKVSEKTVERYAWGPRRAKIIIGILAVGWPIEMYLVQ